MYAIDTCIHAQAVQQCSCTWKETFPCLTGGSATARRRAKGTTADGACTDQSGPGSLAQIAQQARASHQGGMTTRSRSKHALGASLVSLESRVKTAEGPAPALPEESQAIPEVPNGPLVISAGWGRTGTSSLKVWPSDADAGHDSAH